MLVNHDWDYIHHFRSFSSKILFQIELPFLAFDFYVSLKVSKKFYLLLKGMSEEAKWHSTPQEYKEKQRTTKTFAILQSIPLFTFIFGLILVVAESIRDSTYLTKGCCLVQYLFPNNLISFTIPDNLIRYYQGWQVLSTWTKPSGFNQVKTVLSKTSWVDKTGQNWTKPQNLI